MLSRLRCTLFVRLFALAFLITLSLLPTSSAQTNNVDRYSVDDFSSVEKIDVHTHIHLEDLDFVAMSKRDRFRFLNMTVIGDSSEHKRDLVEKMFSQHFAEPDRSAPVSSFTLGDWRAEDWNAQKWQQSAINEVNALFDRGAVGIKIWKNIGMELRDRNGDLVMIDDPIFDPVIRQIEDRQKVLLGHLGEPKNCWLPLDQMTTKNDRSYFAENPQYHMFQHPHFPSYEEQMQARDRMLEKHPNLSFLGCHLASLSWNVEEVGSFLDRFPNANVEVAARMGQIQHQTQQNRTRVIEFFTKYQDRILYGTDASIEPGANVARAYEQLRERWIRDWSYFNTDNETSVPELDDPVQGIALPKSVVDKIYRLNALKMFSSSWSQLRAEEKESASLKP